MRSWLRSWLFRPRSETIWLLGQLFEQYQGRLEQMVRLRLDQRLQGRLDPADVLQEVFLDFVRRLPDYTAAPKLPFYLWLRLLTGQKLVDLHRQHLGAQMRDAGLEISLQSGPFPRASSKSVAELVLSRLTSPSRAAIRAETQLHVQRALNEMDPMDREVLVLRHFEMLSNEETARVLEIKPSAASNRHLRALKRLKDILIEMPGLSDRPHGIVMDQLTRRVAVRPGSREIVGRRCKSREPFHG